MKKIILAFIIVFSMLSVFMFSGCSSDEKAYNTVLAFSALDGEVSADVLSEEEAVIEARLSAVGITDHKIDTDGSDDKITVKFNKPDKIDYDIADYLTTQAKVTFRPGNEYQSAESDDNGAPVYKTPINETKTVLMDGSVIKSAKSEIRQIGETAEPVLLLEFNAEGTEKFKSLTERYTNKIISIWLDDEMLAAPTVQVPITDGQVIVSGNFTIEEATKIANQINSGTLPYPLE